MQGASLQTIMNRMASAPEQIAHEPAFSGQEAQHSLSDVLPFLGTDPVILDLYKRYLDARAEYQSAILEHGQDDPLTEITAEYVDNAWCALQSRLYALSQNKAAAARAALLQTIDHVSEDARRERAAREEQAALWRRQFAARRAREDKESALLLWWLLACIFIRRQAETIASGGWRSFGPAFVSASVH